MQPKKNPKYDVHRKRFLFFNIGLVLSLAITTTAFEWKTPFKMEFNIEETNEFLEELETLEKIQEQEPPKPAQPKSSEKSLQDIEDDEIVLEVHLDI